jgi:TfoX/Sxy family transcriptional regulator of competence genes
MFWGLKSRDPKTPIMSIWKRRILMASKLDFVQYIVEQLHDMGCVTYRKMFGEYGLYLDGKIFALVCDDQLFIKITNAGRTLCPKLREAAPYKGAKNYFLIEDVDNRSALVRLAMATYMALPEPKQK